MLQDNEPQKSVEKDEDLKTFDMYHFFSRKDVIAIILFILAMLLIIVFKVNFATGIA